MYFPYLKIRLYEKSAILNTIMKYEDNKVIPILDPFTNNDIIDFDDFSIGYKLIDFFIESKKKFILIVREQSEIEEISKHIAEGIQYCIFGIYSSTIEYFVSKDTKIAILHDSDKYRTDNINILYHIFTKEAQFNSFMSNFTKDKKVFLEDAFIACETNRDYPPENMFSDLYSTYNREYVGFGDYLTLDRNFKIPDGANMNYITVALHLTYKPVNSNILKIRHYLTTPEDQIECKNRIKTTLKKAYDDRYMFYNTSGIAIMNELVVENKGTNLAKLKQISLQNHIDLIHSLI